MHLVDSHAHLDFPELREELPEVLEAAEQAGVRTILAVGIGQGPSQMHQARDIAREFSGQVRIVASAGIHPQQADEATAEALQQLDALASDPLVVAVGEIGLDYYHADNPLPAVQQEAFRAQMRIAVQHRKPILVHCRTSELATAEAKERFGTADAFAGIIELAAEDLVPHGVPGVMHCFSGTPQQALQALELGFYISFAGNVTYTRFEQIREAAKQVPLDRILVETDAPFLAPVPLRGQRNQPAHTRLTAAFVAALRGMELEELATATTENFNRLFGLR